MRRSMRALPAWLFALALSVSALGCQSKDETPRSEGTDGSGSAGAAAGALGDAAARSVDVPAQGTAEALAVADRVMKALGGERAWEETRYLTWSFFGTRKYWWDKKTGDVRLESGDLTVLLNVRTETGSVRKGGEEIVDPARLASYLGRASDWWVNDSYWMFMPYMLQDPGVNLTHGGRKSLADGTLCDVLVLTFEGEGAPRAGEKYEVWVGTRTDRVVQWSHYARAVDVQPKFTLPWGGWQQFGRIWLATQHGQGKDWQIAVPDRLPESLFQSFEPVAS